MDKFTCLDNTIGAENITYIKNIGGNLFDVTIHYIIQIARNLFYVTFSGVAASELQWFRWA